MLLSIPRACLRLTFSSPLTPSFTTIANVSVCITGQFQISRRFPFRLFQNNASTAFHGPLLFVLQAAPCPSKAHLPLKPYTFFELRQAVASPKLRKHGALRCGPLLPLNAVSLAVRSRTGVFRGIKLFRVWLGYCNSRLRPVPSFFPSTHASLSAIPPVKNLCFLRFPCFHTPRTSAPRVPLVGIPDVSPTLFNSLFHSASHMHFSFSRPRTRKKRRPAHSSVHHSTSSLRPVTLSLPSTTHTSARVPLAALFSLLPGSRVVRRL
ncbi:hypothetical protein TRVL_01927 [Trypanosoma vivax]|nr:hypothetical protein TRVL_01927 [Trypanosoma vivax]